MKSHLMAAVATAALFVCGTANAQTSTESGNAGGGTSVIEQQPSGGSDNSAKQYAPGQQEEEPAKKNAPGQQTDGTAKENAPGQMKKGQTTEETSSKKQKSSSDAAGKSDQSGDSMNKKKTSSEAVETEQMDGSKDGKKSSDASTESGGATGATEKAGKIDIPSDKRAEVHKSFTSKSVKRVNIDIDVSVGIRVPADRVVLYDVPPTIIRIVPAFRRYKYFVLADGTIVIVDPGSFVVVYVLRA